MEKYLENKNGFWWLLLKEIIYTVSNKPSLISSKRLERFVMFNISMWLIIFYVKKQYDEMTITDVATITSILLFGSGWNAVQIRKDIKANESTNDTSNDTTIK